jgi:hypothetical protein
MLWVVRIVTAMLVGLFCYLLAMFAFDDIFSLLIFAAASGLTLLLIKR